MTTTPQGATSPASAGELVLQALTDEQERLRKLPFVVPTTDYFDDYYGGKLVLAPCHYSGKEPKLRYESNPKLGSECGYCHLKAVDGDTVVDGKFVEHARALHVHDQVERLVGLVCAVVGFDEWSDAGLYARAATREESARRLSFDGQLARAVSYLAEQLVRRDATQGAHAALKDLVEFQCHPAEAPFLSEAGLYDLIGKDDARSVLSRVRGLTTAMGGVTT